MTTIKISNLDLSGHELLSDTESYLDELIDEESNMTFGGVTPVIAGATIVTLLSLAVSYPIATAIGNK